jgi:superfamily II DNA or RNA helicase
MKPWYYNRMKKNGNEHVVAKVSSSPESGVGIGVGVIVGGGAAKVGMRNIPYRPVAGPVAVARSGSHFPGRFPGKGVGVGIGASRETQKPKISERENQKEMENQKEKEMEKEIDEEYKQKVCENSYLGMRGYTIPKSVLDKEEIQFLKKATTIKPKVSGPTFGPPGVGGAQDVKPYPYFRENDAKFFLPRMYGISRYGLPFETQLSFGREVESGALDFASDKPLRDYQTHIIGTYLDHVRKQVLEFETETEEEEVGMEQTLYGGGGILEVPCGRGKTVMALKIISELKCPALIYVNKGFLADQWIERIATYLPNASVGRVQGDTFDIENRDIVICMIQTIYNRDYVAKNEFKDFGITIIDEVHRIGSGEFSKALFNITTPYVLGISATVDRKDGMESVLKMFLGGMLYSDKRQDGECVQIRCVEYADPEDVYYNKEEHDFRGNIKYSTMMSKICEHPKRTDFLYRLLCDLVAEYPENLSEEFPDACVGVKDLVVIEKQEPQVECPVCHGQVGLSKMVNISCKHSLCEKCLDDLEQPKCPTCKKRFTLVFSGTGDADGSKTPSKTAETKSETVLTEYPGQNQIIVLAQYREVLRELYARITEKGLTTVGYYVGGMKQKDLDISKTKQIILATYSMASEGLDVATLSTLVFATPRTDIKQSVGRILRQKHARNPIVVDVVDTHKTFKNQATKRRTYYRQNGYAIYKCGYDEYRDMTEVETRWKVAYHPSKAKVCKSDAAGAAGAAGGGAVAEEEASDSDADEKKLAFDGVCML